MSDLQRRYRSANLLLAAASLLLVAAPRALTLTPSGDGLLLPGGGRVPELCLRKRLTGEPSRSCHIGRSVVLAAHGDLGDSAARHPGGLLLFGWLAAHGVARLGLVLAAPRGRLWWLDLALTAASLFLISAVAALLRSPLLPSGA